MKSILAVVKINLTEWQQRQIEAERDRVLPYGTPHCMIADPQVYHGTLKVAILSDDAWRKIERVLRKWKKPALKDLTK